MRVLNVYLIPVGLVLWARHAIGLPCAHAGTELGGAFLTGSTLLPASPSVFTTPALGTQLCLMGSAQPAPAGATLIRHVHQC